MTNETMAAFIRRLAEDRELQAEFFELASRYGFDFLEQDEATDSELDDVAGGTLSREAEDQMMDSMHRTSGMRDFLGQLNTMAEMILAQQTGSAKA